MVRRRQLPLGSQTSPAPAWGNILHSQPLSQGLLEMSRDSHASTQLLPAANKGCLMPRTAGCLWALTRSKISPGEHDTAVPPTTTPSPAPHGAWVAQDQAMAPSTSSTTECPGAQPLSLCTTSVLPAHQFSLLMWSPKPGVSMTVSFMRTPFSSISERQESQRVPMRQVLMGALDKPTLLESGGGLEFAPRGEMNLHSF